MAHALLFIAFSVSMALVFFVSYAHTSGCWCTHDWGDWETAGVVDFSRVDFIGVPPPSVHVLTRQCTKCGKTISRKYQV